MDMRDFVPENLRIGDEHTSPSSKTDWLPLKPDNIPEELKDLPKWVGWIGLESEGKVKKLPYDVKTGKVAKTSEPSTWNPWDVTIDRYHNPKKKKLDGVGFMLSSDDPYCGWDLDKCRDPETGEIEKWATDIVKEMDSYTEVSPSGTGLRILFKGTLPEGGRKQGKIEVYEKDRYLTLTGHLHGTPTAINERTKQAAKVYAREISKRPKNEPQDAPTEGGGGPLDDMDLLRRSFTWENGPKYEKLFEGDPLDCPNRSEADLVFCNHLAFLFKKEPDRIDAAFRQSGLMRNKWDEKRGRETYGTITINKAIAGTTKTYNSRGKKDARAEPPNRETLTEMDEWPEPVLLDKSTPPIFPVDDLPSPLDVFSKTVSEFTQTPVELCAAISLAVLASASASKYRVIVKPGYHEPVNEYFVAGLDAGERKSAVFNLCLKPLNAWEKEQREEIEPKVVRAKSKRKTYEKKIDNLRREAAKAEIPKIDAIQDQIDQLQDSMPEIPVIPKAYTEDVTPEAFVEDLAEQDGRLSIFSDEGGIFEIMAGLYNGGTANFDILLKGHSGTTYKKKRVGKSPVIIRETLVSIGLAVQPEIIEKLGSKKGFRGKGLIARFKYLLPTSRIGSRIADPKPINQSYVDHYNQVIRYHLERSLNTEQDGNVTPYCLTLSEQARNLYREHFGDIEKRMLPGGDLELMTDIGGKAPGTAVRLAGLFHIAETVTNTPDHFEISGETMAAAIRINNCLLAHAAIALGLMSTDPEIQNAVKIWNWIWNRFREKGFTSFTGRECQQNFKKQMGRKAVLDVALEVLIERCYIRDLTPNKVRAKQYDVNPMALKLG